MAEVLSRTMRTEVRTIEPLLRWFVVPNSVRIVLERTSALRIEHDRGYFTEHDRTA